MKTMSHSFNDSNKVITSYDVKNAITDLLKIKYKDLEHICFADDVTKIFF